MQRHSYIVCVWFAQRLNYVFELTFMDKTMILSSLFEIFTIMLQLLLMFMSMFVLSQLYFGFIKVTVF
jgi:hypothetical protein